jgi:hypothetical protein
MFRNKIRNPVIVLLLVAFTVIGGGVVLRALANEAPPKQPVAQGDIAAPQGLKEKWGLPTQGLQMSITASGKDKNGRPEFEVAIRNVGEQDLSLNLGMMLGNGKPRNGSPALFPHSIRLNLIEATGKTRELHLFGPGSVGGTLYDFVVPLRVGSVYTLKLPLSEFWSPSTREFSLDLKPGQNQISAQFEGGGEKIESGKLMRNFWEGKLQSNTLNVTVPAT